MKYYLLFASYMMAALQASAQPGTLDSSFGYNGSVIDTRTLGIPHAMAIQADDKIILGGQGVLIGYSSGAFLLKRYTKDGGYDSSFGENGIVETRFSEVAAAVSLAVQTDGKILAAGTIASDIAVIRYQENGLLDSSFGTNGVSVIDLGAGEYTHAMALQTDGKILVTGFITKNQYDDKRAFTVRFLSNGSADAGFGKNGTVITEFTSQIQINDITVQPDGRIVTGGTYNTILSGRFMLVRYLWDGSLDSSFGENGFAISQINGYLNAIALQEDGKILGAGNGTAPNADKISDMQLMRFNANGTSDSSFGTDSRAFAVFGVNGKDESAAKDVLVQPDGKIIIAGDNFPALQPYIHFAMARFTKNGIADSVFGENGLQSTGFETYDVSYAVGLQKSGKILLGGDIGDEFGNSYAVARYYGDDKKIPHWIVRILRWILHHWHLQWEPVPGNDVQYFAVERSSDGFHFTEIARIANSAWMNTYSYDDATAPKGKIYYRIRQADKNGNVVYSDIMSGITPAETSVRVVPNPVKDVLRLEGLDAGSTAKISIVNLQGYTVDAATASGNSFIRNVSGLKRGTYYITIQQENEVLKFVFLKE